MSNPPKKLYCKSGMHRFEGPHKVITTRGKYGGIVTRRVICMACYLERQEAIRSVKPLPAWA